MRRRRHGPGHHHRTRLRRRGLGRIVIIGAGPAGLFAAETLAGLGHGVAVHEAMAAPARKLLMAGRGGLNLTHSEPPDAFVGRYGDSAAWLAPILAAFPPEALRAWADGLGAQTFVGSSGRVFPRAMKASPLLRAWLGRLDRLGVRLATRSRWTGWDADGAPMFETEAGLQAHKADALLLAAGGAAWPRLGSDGAWAGAVGEAGVRVTPFAPSNCGVRIDWPETGAAAGDSAGAPLKAAAFKVQGSQAPATRGDAVLTRSGLEGGALYAWIPALRACLDAGRPAWLEIDLRPDMDAAALAARLGAGKGGRSAAGRMAAARLSPAARVLLRAGAGGPLPGEPAGLAARIKAVRLRVSGLAGLERAISSAGGVALAELDGRLMARARPGLFVAGEALDWDAPTGGYLLQACFATARAAALGIDAWLAEAAAGA